MNFGMVVRERRASLRMSLREVASQVEVDPAYLSRVEAGKAPPSDHLIERLAAALACSPDELALSAGRLPATAKTILEQQPALGAAALRNLTDGMVAEPRRRYGAPITRSRNGRKGKAGDPVTSGTSLVSGTTLSLFPDKALDQAPPPANKRLPQTQNSPHHNTRVDPRNRLNALTAREWIPETVSVWTQRGLGANHQDAQVERQHPAPFSFTDVSRLIRFFTKPGETVLDPFVGVGSTLKACALEGRNGVGVELNKHYAMLAKKRLRAEVRDIFATVRQQQVVVGDARQVLRDMSPASIDFVVTSPPYWSILRKEDHKANQERKRHNLSTNYGDDPRDLGNIREYPRFLAELSDILGVCVRLLRPKRYMALVVSDFRDKSRYIMFHADLATALAPLGLGLRGITILYQRHKKVYPYGYPYGFVPNIHHQYILILQRER